MSDQSKDTSIALSNTSDVSDKKKKNKDSVKSKPCPLCTWLQKTHENSRKELVGHMERYHASLLTT